MKRFISLVLSLCIILSCSVTAFAWSSPHRTDLPTVYVHGQGAPLYTRSSDGSLQQVYPLALPDDFMETTVKGNLDVFKRAFFTQNWDEFCVVLHDIFKDLFKDIKLDENGEAPNGSCYPSQGDPDPWTYDGKYALDQFDFNYDWRMDPFKTAEELHDYIEKVLAVTGAEKVNLIGRCLGASITGAYMQKYDGEHIASWLLYNSAMNGETQCSRCFAGRIYLKKEGVNRYMYDLALFPDEVLNTLLQSFVTLLEKTGGLDIACWAVNNVYRQIYLQIVPPTLLDSFGSFPGYWSMVNDRDYEEAKRVIFYGQDMDKWANFIQIIDNYHYNVQVAMPELVKHFNDMGIQTACITKYGAQSVPVDRDSDLLSDSMCSVADSSFGATTAGIVDTFGKKYLKTANMKYVSADLQIDASTCLMPDRSWFIKDLGHKNFPACVEELMAAILNNPEMTVFTSEQFPQFLKYEEDTDSIVPLTEENCHSHDRYRVTFFTALKRFWKSVFTLVQRYIQAKRSNS